jgi:hypothetical protein
MRDHAILANGVPRIPLPFPAEVSVTRPSRTTLACAAAILVTFGLALTPGSARAASTVTRAATRPVPSVVGRPPVARPAATRPRPLPTRSGSVPLTRAVRPAVATDQVGVRALVVAVNADDFGLPTWQTTLDRVGAAYDVLLTQNTPLTAASLVRPDGAGKYDAILLTNAMQLYQDAAGNYVSGLDSGEWNTLWAYERQYGVRQAVLYGSYGTWPEDYCLRPVSEGSVGATPIAATLTATGAPIFDYLRSTAQIPISQSYLYRTSVAAGCAAQPVLTNGSDVLGVLSTSTDGRERLELTFSNNQYLLQSDLLVYGLFRWASRGVFLGEQKHYLDVDVDDWFNTSDEYLPGGTIVPDGYQMTAADAYNLFQQQTALRAAFPAAAGFTAELPYNGGDADLTAGDTCSPTGWVDQLTATSRCLRDDFRWVNHTADHVEFNFSDYATTHDQIATNITDGTTLGLPLDPTVLKTPGYSGLGTYNPDPNDDINPPTDHGLGASNPALLSACTDLGVKYLHGNMSFPSQVPAVFDGGIVHPLASNLLVVPDWPTNIAYDATTPDEETAFYNYLYGPGGKFPYWPANLTYRQVISAETDIGLQHVTSGSAYLHTFHIGNVRNYGGGGTLLNDWLTSLLTKYTSYYSVPLISQGFTAIAHYAEARNAHAAERSAGVDAVYDRAAGTVTVTTPAGNPGGSIILSGTGTTSYGSDVSAQLTLAAGSPLTVTASPRP